MKTLIAAEILKLRLTPLTWGFVGGAVGLAALRMAMVVLSAGTAAGVARASTTATLTMLGAASLGSVMLLLLGVTAVTSEYRHATIAATVLVVPNRRSVVIAKFLAYALVGALLGLGLALLGLAVGTATRVGGRLGLYLLPVIPAAVLGAVFLSALGVGIGLLIHNQVVALVVPVTWLLIVEPLTQSFGLRFLLPWLPGTLTGELGPGGPAGSLPPWLAGVTLSVYCLLLAVLGTHRLQRADIV
jgi:ABC-2 type transport system permease protein